MQGIATKIVSGSRKYGPIYSVSPMPTILALNSTSVANYCNSGPAIPPGRSLTMLIKAICRAYGLEIMLKIARLVNKLKKFQWSASLGFPLGFLLCMA